jgi:hypothetical protein
MALESKRGLGGKKACNRAQGYCLSEERAFMEPAQEQKSTNNEEEVIASSIPRVAFGHQIRFQRTEIRDPGSGIRPRAGYCASAPPSAYNF